MMRNIFPLARIAWYLLLEPATGVPFFSTELVSPFLVCPFWILSWLAFSRLTSPFWPEFMSASPFSMTGQQPLEGFPVLLSNSKENSSTHFNISIFH
jgi:hypothetical protein